MKLTSLRISLILSVPLWAVADPVLPNPAAASEVIPNIGSVTNPSGKTQITGNAEHLKIAMPAGDHALDIERNRMSAPRVLQEVTGDFAAQVKVTGAYPENTSTEVRGRRPFQGAGLLLWVSPETYIRLERAQVKVEAEGEVKHFVYPSWELRSEGKSLRMASGADGIFSGSSATLRITRTGNKVVAAVSEDGNVWRDLDPLMVKLPEKVQVGVVAGHNTTTPFEATLENFTVKPLTKEE